MKGDGDGPVRPAGWRILVRPKEVARQTAGGIHLLDETVQGEEYLLHVGQVVAVGETAFSDERLFPGRRRLYEVGQWVLFPQHAGMRIRVQEGETRVAYRILNDDQVVGTVSDPDAVLGAAA